MVREAILIMIKRKTTTPKQVTDILVLREAGYTVLAISQKVDKSQRTISRVLAKYGAKKGALKKEVVERARSEMIALVKSSSAIKEEAAKLVLDDIAHSNHLRDVLLKASEHLIATDVKEAALVMRAAAAYSTTLKNTSDTVRHSLDVGKGEDTIEDMPELVIREITGDEAMAMTLSSMVEDEADNEDC